MKTLFIAIDFDPEHFEEDFEHLKKEILLHHEKVNLTNRFQLCRGSYTREFDVIPAEGPGARLERLEFDEEGYYYTDRTQR